MLFLKDRPLGQVQWCVRNPETQFGCPQEFGFSPRPPWQLSGFAAGDANPRSRSSCPPGIERGEAEKAEFNGMRKEKERQTERKKGIFLSSIRKHTKGVCSDGGCICPGDTVDTQPMDRLVDLSFFQGVVAWEVSLFKYTANTVLFPSSWNPKTEHQSRFHAFSIRLRKPSLCGGGGDLTPSIHIAAIDDLKLRKTH